MLQNIARKLDGWSLPARLDEYVLLDESNVYAHLVSAAKEVSKDESSFKELEGQIRDLILDRNLWKKVYEYTHHDKESSREYTKQARESLRNLGVEFEYVSSTTALTKFASHAQNDCGDNYLGLIKKDEFQMVRVVGIEKYSEIFSQKSVIQIERLYVARSENRAYSNPNVITNDLVELLMSSEAIE